MNITTSPPPNYEASRLTIVASTSEPESFPNLDDNQKENSSRSSLKNSPTLGKHQRINTNGSRQHEYIIPGQRQYYRSRQVIKGLLDTQPIKEQGRLRAIWRNKWTLLFGLGWIFPMLALLILNGTEYVVGAQIGCKSCRVDPTQPNVVQRLQQQDTENHNKLIALQFVAKIIEDWFLVIAASLIYNYAILLAKRRILPLRLLTVHSEFHDLKYSLETISNSLDFSNKQIFVAIRRGSLWRARQNRSLWRTIRREGLWNMIKEDIGHIREVEFSSLFRSQQRYGTVEMSLPELRRNGSNVEDVYDDEERNPVTEQTRVKCRKMRMFWFILTVVLMCILYNLMQVASAALVLPSLQWMDINVKDNVIFGRLDSDLVPQYQAGIQSPLRGCSKLQITNRQYNCTSAIYGASLDALIAAGAASANQVLGRNSSFLPAVSQEMEVSFSFNLSQDSTVLWSASRQLLRNFSSDVYDYEGVTQPRLFGDQIINKTYYNPDYPNSYRFNQSVQAKLQRTGPTFGINNRCYVANRTVIDLPTINSTGLRQVLCYNATGDNYVKCIPFGLGWPRFSLDQRAHIMLPDLAQDVQNTYVSFYSTKVARYLPPHSPCLAGNSSASNSSTSCNWDNIFQQPQQAQNTSGTIDLRNWAANQITVEYSLNAITGNSVNQMVWCNTVAFLGFTSYNLDLKTPIEPTHLIQYDSPTAALTANESIYLHPDWILAAWSANRINEITDPDGYYTVSGYRGSAYEFVNGVATFAGQTVQGDSILFNAIHSYSIAQALSFVPYSTVPTTNNKQYQNGTIQVFRSSGSVQLWKYSHNGALSISSMIVGSLGILVVLIRTCMYLEEEKSPTELIIEALQHPILDPNLELDEKSGAPVLVSLCTKANSPSLGARRPRLQHHRHSSTLGFHYPRESFSSGTIASQQPDGNQG
jgi:hypothetical protein